MTRSGSRAPLFDHLVGRRKQRRGHIEAERLRRFKVDHHLKFRRRLHRQVGRFLTAQDAINDHSGL
jgi:hypothetical protein